ncbi:MAG TPA: zf-HC2 domain-containing protein [Longimicrobiales bacterium]
MNCRDFFARHSEYVDGVIDAEGAGRMSAHARTCPRCARYDRVVRRGGALVRELPALTVSSDFDARMRHRLYHVRDELSERRPGAAPVYVAVASVVLAIGAAGVGSFVMGETPVVDAHVVFAAAPPAWTPVDAEVLLAPVPAPATLEKDAGPVTPLAAETHGHDGHLATPVAWPVYSREGVAAAFAKPGADVIVKPAEFRASFSGRGAGPILVRH